MPTLNLTLKEARALDFLLHCFLRTEEAEPDLPLLRAVADKLARLPHDTSEPDSTPMEG